MSVGWVGRYAGASVGVGGEVGKSVCSLLERMEDSLGGLKGWRVGKGGGEWVLSSGLLHAARVFLITHSME